VADYRNTKQTPTESATQWEETSLISLETSPQK
jgi:hypothetical protein